MNQRKKSTKSDSRRLSHSTRQQLKSNSLAYSMLEPRHLLATFFVDSVADDASGGTDGMLTLREAIMASQTNAAFGDASAGDADGDVIRFDASLTGQTITLTNGEFTLTDDVSIFGDATGITIDANFLSRIFNVNSSEQIVFRDINLVNGTSLNVGGAVAVAGMGETVLNNVSITNSTAAGTGGGAIANTDNSLLVLNSNISENSAIGLSGSGGGLLITSGDVRVVDSVIAANIANRAGGGIEIVDGRLDFVNSTLGGSAVTDGNIAGPGGASNPGNGGGLHVTGSNGTLVSIKGGSIQNNVAALEGGGLWNQSGSTINVRDAQVIDNIAQGDAADDGGGGVFNNGGTTRFRNSIVSGNQATGTSGSGGGAFSIAGLLSIMDSTLSSNVANRAGGGIEIVDGELFVVSTVIGGLTGIEGNIAGPVGSANPGNGGGLHVSGTNGTSSYFRDSTIQNNVASVEGGGLWNQTGSTLRVIESQVIGNVASGDAADDGGGGIFNNGGTTRVRDSLISGNVADGLSGSGGGIFSMDGLLTVRTSTVSANVANRAGGGIEVVNGTALIRDTMLGGQDEADGNIAGPAGSASPGNGGGLHVSGTNGTQTSVLGSTVENNVAASEGGGLWNQSGSTLVVGDGAEIINNVASGNDAGNGGGGIFNNGGRVSIMDAIVSGNTADGSSGSGGGLLSTDGLVTVLDSIFSENTAIRAGGGIELIDGTFLMIDSILSQNVAGPAGSESPGNGGGLHISGSNGTYASIDNTIVSGNVAANEGGGLWNQIGSTLDVRNESVITGNMAGSGGGGGIFNNGNEADGGILNVIGASVTGNSTSGDGGGIKSLAGSVLRVDNSSVSSNNADLGGGIYNDGIGFITQSVISFNDADTDGGGVFTDTNGDTSLFDSSLNGNTPNNEN